MVSIDKPIQLTLFEQTPLGQALKVCQEWCLSYRESTKGSNEMQGVHFTEESIL